MTRQTIADPQTFSPAQREEYDSTLRALKMTPRADGALGGPFDSWLLNPELAKRLRDLGVFLWNGTSLDRSLVSLPSRSRDASGSRTLNGLPTPPAPFSTESHSLSSTTYSRDGGRTGPRSRS